MATSHVAADPRIDEHGRTQSQKGSHIRVTKVRTFVSLAAFGDTHMITMITSNVLKFLPPTRLALHVSTGSKFRPSRSTLRHWDPTVLYNPNPRGVKRRGPQVLGIHLSNIAVLAGSSVPPAGWDRIVFMPGNSVLVRPCNLLVGRAPVALAHHNKRLMDDKATRVSHMHETWRNWIKAADAQRAGFRPAPLATSFHEGSWYPFHVLNDSIKRFRSTPLDHSSGLRACCLDCEGNSHMECLLEETVLPTVIVQHYPKLAERAVPPLVFIYWSHKVRPAAFYSSNLSALDPDYCGFKLVHDDATKHKLTTQLLEMYTFSGHVF